MQYFRESAGKERVLMTKAKRAYGDTILLYRLVREQMVERQLTYSVSITKINNGGSRRELKYLRDISRSKNEAENIFKLLSGGKVFPENAEEITWDLLSI